MASGDDGQGTDQLKKNSRLQTPKLLRRKTSHSKKKVRNSEELRKDTETLENSIQEHDLMEPTSSACDRQCTRNTSPHCFTPNNSSVTHNGEACSPSNVVKGNPVTKRKSKSLLPRKKKSDNSKMAGKSFSKFWTFRIKKKVPCSTSNTDAAQPCICTGLRHSDEVASHGSLRLPSNKTNMMGSSSPIQPSSARSTRLALGAGPGPSGIRHINSHLFQMVPAPQNAALIDVSRANHEDYQPEDIDEMMIAQRARDIELGIEISPNHSAYPNLHYSSSISSSSSSGSSLNEHTNLSMAFQNQCVVTTTTLYTGSSAGETLRGHETFRRRESEYGDFGSLPIPSAISQGNYIPRTVHTQVDFIHCLVPSLVEIARFSSYWGVIDRYEAERLLENRPEGTFLLRDSAQEEFLFSVSFRRYGRSLHARIEQWNHKFSFDSHDPGVFSSDSVCGLIEHYKDPNCCMFFEPMLTNPLNRTFPFSLQHLCRAVICNNSTYDGLNFLPLPKSLRDYLKYYHYKQKVRVRRFEVHH